MPAQKTNTMSVAGQVDMNSEAILIHTSHPSHGEFPHRGSRGRVLRVIVICLASLLGFLAILFIAAFFYGQLVFNCSTIVNPRSNPRREWSDFKEQPFAVGFDLTAGYGTAAIAFKNGTIVNVARVEGTPEYNDVLARLSLKSAAHSTPPYYNCQTELADLGRQWSRYLRKRVGLPASSDVAALAGVLSKLKEQTNTLLGSQGPLELAFATIPNLPALYLEDLVDAAEHVQFQLLTLPWYIYRSGDQAEWPVSEINTASAGNFGMDQLSAKDFRVPIDKLSPRNIQVPLLGDRRGRGRGSNRNRSDDLVPKKPWSDNMLSVLITNTALTAHITPLSWAPHFYAASGIVNFSLGLSSPHLTISDLGSHSQSNPSYWSEVRLALREALDSYLPLGHQLGRVVSYGEGAHNEMFDNVLKEEVIAAQYSSEPEQRPQFWSLDPVFAAARGAAIFARFCSTLERPEGCLPDLTPQRQGW